MPNDLALLDEVARLTAENKALRGRLRQLEWIVKLAGQLSDEPTMAHHSGAQAVRAAIQDLSDA